MYNHTWTSEIKTFIVNLNIVLKQASGLKSITCQLQTLDSQNRSRLPKWVHEVCWPCSSHHINGKYAPTCKRDLLEEDLLDPEEGADREKENECKQYFVAHLQLYWPVQSRCHAVHSFSRLSHWYTTKYQINMPLTELRYIYKFHSLHVGLYQTKFNHTYEKYFIFVILKSTVVRYTIVLILRVFSPKCQVGFKNLFMYLNDIDWTADLLVLVCCFPKNPQLNIFIYILILSTTMKYKHSMAFPFFSQIPAAFKNAFLYISNWQED